jgi:hypothetical protein
MLERISRRKVDRSYQNEYKTFVTWAEQNGFRKPGTHCKYIHRPAIHAYFSRGVVGRDGARNHIGRIHQALQWMYTNVEDTGDPRTVYTLRDATVVAAINQQQENWRNGGSRKHLGADPHNGLKDLMAMSEKLKVVRYMHETRGDWGALTSTFTWGCNCGVRGASSRRFVYSDLNLSHGFGPEKEGDRNRTLMLVLRKGTAHKDKFTTDKQVGTWRHKFWELCSQFNLSLSVINDLRNDSTVNFLHEEKDQRAPWWDKPLIEFDKPEEDSGAMKQVYRDTGVKSCKLTHHRTHAVQLAGSEGLAPWQITTMTKHMLDKLNSAYQPEMDRETAKVRSGHERDEPYFQGTSHLQAPMPVSSLMDLLLPKYGEWCEQQQSRHGDKSSCCETFLYSVLPYMVEVVVQDGIYLIEKFPEHEMSMYLKVCYYLTLLVQYTMEYNTNFSLFSLLYQNQIPGYETWAAAAHTTVVNLQATRRQDKIQCMEAATRAAVAKKIENCANRW